jgi:leucyl-tRNA synthetase
VVAELLKTEEGKARLAGDETDIRKAKRVIVVRGGALVNFVL